MPLSLRTPVLDYAGTLVFRADAGEVDRMLTLGQAVRSKDKRSLRLKPITATSADEAPAGRTHTSRGGLLAAIGRSQQYTTANGRGQVDGFKAIYPEDRYLFRAAVLDALRPAAA